MKGLQCAQQYVAIALLRADDVLLESVVAGDGGLVLVQGPAGIGKTPLLRACAERARERGTMVLQGPAIGTAR